MSVLVDFKDLSQWEIFIDDVCGELGMQKIKHTTGRNIDVVAKEEIMPLYEKLQAQLKAEQAKSRDYEEVLMEVCGIKEGMEDYLQDISIRVLEKHKQEKGE